MYKIYKMQQMLRIIIELYDFLSFMYSIPIQFHDMNFGTEQNLFCNVIISKYKYIFSVIQLFKLYAVHRSMIIRILVKLRNLAIKISKK